MHSKRFIKSLEQDIAKIHCNDDVSGPGGAGGHGVSNDPPDSEEAFLKANIGQQASGIERAGGEGDGGSGDGGSVEGDGGSVSGKRGKVRKVYKWEEEGEVVSEGKVGIVGVFCEEW